MQCLLFLLQDWSTYHRLNSNWGVLTAHISCCLSLCYQPCALQGMAVGRVPGWAASHKNPDTQAQQLLWELLDTSSHAWWWKRQHTSVTTEEWESLSLLEKLIGTWSQGLSSGRGMKDSGAAENWRRPCYILEGKHGQAGKMGRNIWYLEIERQAEKRKAAWKRWLSLGSPNICGSTPHLALIPPYGERQPVVQFGF